MWCCVTARQRLQNLHCLCDLESTEMRPSPSDMKTLRFHRFLNTTSYKSFHSIIDEFDTCKHKRQTYMHICIQRQASFLQSRFWVPCRDFRLFQSDDCIRRPRHAEDGMRLRHARGDLCKLCAIWRKILREYIGKKCKIRNAKTARK